MTTLARDFPVRCAASYPNKVAYQDGDRACTWAQLHERSDRFAAALQKLGVAKGDAVAILTHEHIEVYEHLYACYKIGAPRVGINWQFAAREMLYVIQDCDARVILVQANCVKHLEEHIETLTQQGRILIAYGGEHDLPHDYESLLKDVSIKPDLPDLSESDLALISYTSGTTGMPKGVMISQRALREALVHTVVNIGLNHEDVWFAPTSSAWITVVLVSMNCVNGMTSILPNGDFDPVRFLEFIEKYKVTSTIMVPLIMQRLIGLIKEGTYNIDSLKIITFGSSPSTPALIKAAVETFKCDLMQMYGLTETTGGWVAIMRPEDTQRGVSGEDGLLLSCGRPFIHLDLEIRDAEGNALKPGETGEIWIRSDTNMTGYLGLQEQTDEVLQEGWLRTNDIGHLDKEGFLYLTDRKNYLIITGAANVFPRVVENVLDEHPEVAEVAVVGIPHPEWGEAVVAVIHKSADSELDAETLIEFSRSHLAKFEVPKYIDFVETLPRGPTGKILKNKIQEWYKQGQRPLPWKIDNL